jgi:CheY-like chemotaxis protein
VDYRHLFLVTNLKSAQRECGLDRPLPRGEGTIYAQAAALGVDALEDLLAYAQRKDYVEAATAAAQILGDLGDQRLVRGEGGRPRPLVLALQHGDRRLRLAAARAILQVDPRQPYAGSSYLPETLAYLVRTAGSRRVLVANPRQERAQSLIGLLSQIGFEADAAHTGNETFRLAAKNPDYEFVMISDALDHPPATETVQMLRRDPRTSRMPVGLLAREENLDKVTQFAETDPLARAFPRPHDAQTMAYVTNRLTELGGRNLTTRDERLDQAAAALDALGRLAQSPQEYAFYDLQRHESALQAALFVSELSARAAAVLGALGSPSAQRALVTCASQTARPLVERQAAGQAFAAAVRKRGLLLSRDEVLRQYSLYNASAALDEGTQRVLASLLDTIEEWTKKLATPASLPKTETPPAPPAPPAAPAPEPGKTE